MMSALQSRSNGWGRHRSPTTWAYAEAVLPPWLFRGYTGHESVWPFTLTNMNGRMYDPLNGRMLSADNYVQGALGTQGYNRYSYAGNNPMKYTDPDGEFLAIPFFAMSMTAEFLSNLINGVSNPLGQAYSNTSATMSGVGNSLKIHSRVGANGGMSFGINPLNLGLEFGYGRKDGNVSTGFGFGIGLGGPYVTRSISYDFGNVTIGISGGMGADGSPRLGGGVEVGGVSLGITRFGGNAAQWNWQVGYRQGDFSLRMSNDAWMGSDWYRTAAFEVGVGQYSMGINMYTTKPPQGEFDDLRGKNDSYRSMWDSFLRKQPSTHAAGTYSSGSRVWAGLYLGYSDGFTVNRTGISAPWVQDFFQNGVHHFITRSSPYFNTGLGSPTMPFWQVIGHNPWTLY